MKTRSEIIAEIGVNANGNLETAKMLVDAAMEAGADAVKFQATFPCVEMSARLLPDRIKATEAVILSHAQLEAMAAYCKAQAVQCIFTPSEEESLSWLIERINPRRIKIGSDNLTNLPLLRKVGRYALPVILSTGMGTIFEIVEAYAALGLIQSQVTLMHCTSSYPCPTAQANLLAINTLKRSFPCSEIGWSDHTASWLLPSAAVAMGARVIEKHITLDRQAPGPDHRASIDPLGFKLMAKAIREVEDALGSGRKEPQPSEIEHMQEVRKSIIAKRAIDQGDILSEDNIAIMRPAVGRPPDEYDLMLGTRAMRNYYEGEAI